MGPEDPTISHGGPAPRAPGESLLGQTIGPYHVLSLLGEGGFGSVYLADQSQPVRRRVALKVIKPGMDSRAVVARFEAERQALALMDHAGVAKVFDAGVTPAGRPYFAMEHVRGEPITRFCENERLGVEDRVRLMIQVCSAVQHAHMKGVIHRDLKPSNILVELVDGRPAPKIIDFGVAKALSQRLSDSTVFTEHGQMIGTPEYMSPEQARGSAVDVDTRADVYSLGAILYELLTGTTPLDSRELRAGGFAGAQRLIEEGHPPAPSERLTRDRTPSATGTVGRRVRRELDWIVMKCLEKERARRYDSAGAMARDLERYLRDEPVEAGPPSASYRAIKFVRRHRAGVTAAALMAAALVATVAGIGWGLTQATAARNRAEESARAAELARNEAEAVTAFLSDMLGSVDPGTSGREVLVRQVLDRASASIGVSLMERPLVEARLRQTIGNAYRALGMPDQAERHLPRALDLRRRELGREHPDTLRLAGNVAGLRHEQGRFEEAAQLNEEILQAWIAAGKPDDPGALGTRNNLAQVYVRQGKLTEATILQAEALEGYRRVLGPDHPHALGSAVNLASLRESQGDVGQAEGLLLRAVEGWRRAHGPEHPGTLLANNNLAGLYLRQGRVEEAESIYRRVLETRTRVLGEEHPDTIATLSNLALCQSRRGQVRDAETNYLKAWELSRRVLGEEHPDTLTTALNLTSMYEGSGWPAERRDQLAMLLGTLRVVAGREGSTAHDLNSCAWLLLTVEPVSLRDDATALRAATRACELERSAGGTHLWEYLDTLALAQSRAGSPATAAETQREAIGRMPPEGERYRAQMEQRLAEYEAAARGAGAPR